MSRRNSNPNAAMIETTIPLIDPTCKGGLVQVPLSKSHDTKGRSDYLSGLLKKDVSLCCLFQRGRCNAGDKCHQIHVDTDFVAAVREQQRHIISCCRRCRDTYSTSGPAISFFALHFPPSAVAAVRLQVDGSTGAAEGVTAPISPDQLAWTIGLQQYVEGRQLPATAQGTLFLPAKKVCGLHLRAACKYGKDCKNIHLCSQLGSSYLTTTTPTMLTLQRAPAVVADAASPLALKALPSPFGSSSPAVAAPSYGRVQRANSMPSSAAPSNTTGGRSLFDRMNDATIGAAPSIPNPPARSTSAPPLTGFAAPTDEPLSATMLEKSASRMLCFDPELLAAAVNERSRRPSNATVDWDTSFDGGLSSTSSARSSAAPHSTGFFDRQQYWNLSGF